jgi:hypothetical protein
VERLPVDIDPGQIVRWILAENNAAPLSLKTNARRATAVQEIVSRLLDSIQRNLHPIEPASRATR